MTADCPASGAARSIAAPQAEAEGQQVALPVLCLSCTRRIPSTVSAPLTVCRVDMPGCIVPKTIQGLAEEPAVLPAGFAGVLLR